MHAVTYRRNIRFYLALATSEQVADGLAWYAEALETIRGIADDCQLPVNIVAAVVAALSPRNRWNQNLQDARAFCEAYWAGADCPSAATFGANRQRAWSILCERNAGLLSGRKVCAFYANLIGDGSAITVDVWAIRAATRCKVAAVPNDGTYRAVADAYRAVARGTVYTPAQVQAIVWTVIRGL